MTRTGDAGVAVEESDAAQVLDNSAHLASDVGHQPVRREHGGRPRQRRPVQPGRG